MPTQTLFTLIMMLGIVITTSSSSWFSAWLGLEVNALAFIPILASQKSKPSNEAMLKYFLTQALASAMMLVPIMTTPLTLQTWATEPNSVITLVLVMKMGAAPMHFWLPQVMEGLSWATNAILATIQKIAPVFLMMFSTSNLILPLAALSLVTGALGGFNQTSLRKLMAYSSVAHLGGMMAATKISNTLTNMYLSVYIVLSLTIMLMFSKTNFNTTTQSNHLHPTTHALMMINLLSLGGLPPFLGFVPKWVLINLMLPINIILPVTLILTSLITLFFYLRLTYPAFLVSKSTLPSTQRPSTAMMLTATMTIWGLPAALSFL